MLIRISQNSNVRVEEDKEPVVAFISAAQKIKETLSTVSSPLLSDEIIWKILS